VLMAGGYGHVVDTTVDVHLQTLRIAERAQAERFGPRAHASTVRGSSLTMAGPRPMSKP
jgi:hypothetical protein